MMEIWLMFVGMLLEAISVAWAYFEIQIEGPNSWASGLPYSWKKDVSWFSKPITGYHVSLGALGLLVLLFPIAIILLVIGIEPIANYLKSLGGMNLISLFLKTILISLSLLLAIVLHEDFLWNVINPDPRFGVKDFKKKYPQVGKTWYIPHTPMPIDFVIMTTLSLVLALFAGMMTEWLVIFATMLVVTLVIARARYKYDLRQEKAI